MQLKPAFTVIFMICVVPMDFAQTPKPQPYILAEFESVEKSSLTIVIDAFLSVVKNTDDAQGYVVNYGTVASIKNRRKFLMNSNHWNCGYSGCRITFVDGPSRKIAKTTLSILPKGADVPKIDK